MDFYKRFSEHYDLIFPPQKAQIEFLNKLIAPRGRVLDMACGTGNYTISIAKYHEEEIIGVDLDSAMIDIAVDKSKDLQGVKFLRMDMLAIDQLSGKFSLIYCIGNSLPHLVEPQKIREAMNKMYQKLDSSGSVVLQTVNYDSNPQKLSTIENKEHGISFKRNYIYRDEIIDFCTVLEGKDFSVEGKVSLYPIKSSQMVEWLREAGFSKVELYGSFKKDEYSPQESKSLVVVAHK